MPPGERKPILALCGCGGANESMLRRGFPPYGRIAAEKQDDEWPEVRGFRGLRWGVGDPAAAFLDAESWAVVRIEDAAGLKPTDSAMEFQAGTVIYRGDPPGAPHPGELPPSGQLVKFACGEIVFQQPFVMERLIAAGVDPALLFTEVAQAGAGGRRRTGRRARRSARMGARRKPWHRDGGAVGLGTDLWRWLRFRQPWRHCGYPSGSRSCRPAGNCRLGMTSATAPRKSRRAAQPSGWERNWDR